MLWPLILSPSRKTAPWDAPTVTRQIRAFPPANGTQRKPLSDGTTTLKEALEGLSLDGLEPVDSDDFGSEEAERATVTEGPDDLVQRLMKQVRGNQVAKFTLKSHELRRRERHLYYRVRMTATQEPDKVLIFRVDWMQS